MSYEVRDGGLWGRSEHGLIYNGTAVEGAVADALDVLRAAGWTTGTDQIRESGNEFAPVEASTWARSPWRKVDGADEDQKWNTSDHATEAIVERFEQAERDVFGGVDRG